MKTMKTASPKTYYYLRFKSKHFINDLYVLLMIPSYPRVYSDLDKITPREFRSLMETIDGSELDYSVARLAMHCLWAFSNGQKNFNCLSRLSRLHCTRLETVLFSF